jgi:cytochrome c553
MKKSVAILGALLLLALPAMAGEWHTGAQNLCTDCHTMHSSMAHSFDSTTVPDPNARANGNWVDEAGGPYTNLLKGDGNALCTACHDGQSFAPDVLESNSNASPSSGRMAGALNLDTGGSAGWEPWRGHSLGSTDDAPGYQTGLVEAGLDPHPSGTELQCVSCHDQHGTPAYRNLGPASWGMSDPNTIWPTYVIAATNTATADVWINAPTYTANSGSAATFNPYYAYGTINYNRNDASVGPSNIETSNKLDTFCSACHGDFHGGEDDANIGGNVSGPAFIDFERHPTSDATIGAVGGSHSNLTLYTSATAQVKTYSDVAGQTDATPGCVSCHKAHGNQNPFGLFLLNGAAATVDEDGGYGGTLGAAESIAGYGVGLMNLCGQCHAQGINYNE